MHRALGCVYVASCVLLAGCDSTSPSDGPPPEAAIITGGYTRVFEDYTVFLRFTPDPGATQQGTTSIHFAFLNGDTVDLSGYYMTRSEGDDNLVRLLDESCANEGRYFYTVDALSLSFRLATDTCARSRELPGAWERQP